MLWRSPPPTAGFHPSSGDFRDKSQCVSGAEEHAELPPTSRFHGATLRQWVLLWVVFTARRQDCCSVCFASPRLTGSVGTPPPPNSPPHSSPKTRTFLRLDLIVCPACLQCLLSCNFIAQVDSDILSFPKGRGNNRGLHFWQGDVSGGRVLSRMRGECPSGPPPRPRTPVCWRDDATV